MGREGSICKTNNKIRKKWKRKKERKKERKKDEEGNGEEREREWFQNREKISEWEESTAGGAAEKKLEMQSLLVVQSVISTSVRI